MQPYFTNQAYQNFADRTREDWQEAYYGENFSRLVEVKQAYDPDNFFNFQQSIPTEV
jgi:FAD/FMN-containing dehydrogenase